MYNASMIRVRIAPSPTGTPHVGNTRTALFNFLFARHNNGKFILRIEDTDQKRIVSGSVEAIKEILDWLGLIPDEVYIQSDRLSEYKKHAQTLVDKNLAYEKEGAIWIKMPRVKVLSWEDAIGKKHISFKSDLIEDFVVLKSDGFPTYHLASVVDDHLMRISHVIRGDEWISSTPKHLFLYESFSWEPPVFAHLPVILGPDKTKLSKRHGAESVLYYRNQGYLKEALLNFMVLLGWNPGASKEIMNIEEMIKLFDLQDVNTASPIFDLKKLEWMNGMYIRQLSFTQLISKLETLASIRRSGQNSKIEKIDNELMSRLIVLAQTRMTTLNDFYVLTNHFFEEPEIKLSDKEKIITKKLMYHFSVIGDWNSELILKAMKQIMIEEKVKMPVLYNILTGKESGLPLPESLEILGKKKTLERLKGLT